MKRIFVFLLLFAPFLLNAQNTMYFLEHMPQSLSFNPAMSPEVDIFIQLPGLAGSSVDAYNSGFNYYELDEFGVNLGRSSYNPDEFVNSIGEYNRLNAEAKTNICSFGFSLKDREYFSFEVSLHNIFSIKAESELAYLLADLDDLNDDDFPLVVDGITLGTNNYITWSVAYSRKINENLTLGIRPGINFNMLGMTTKDLKYIVNKDEIYDEYNDEFNGEVTLGLPTEINPDAIDGNEFDPESGLFPDGWEEDMRFSDFFRNAALSVDLGATYVLDEWTFSASLLNIGASKWRRNAYTLSGNEEVVRIEESKKIKVGIPPKIYAGTKYQFDEKWNCGFVFQNTFYKKNSNTSATVSLNGDIGSMLSTSVSYTAGYKFDNIGLGLRLRLLPGTDLFVVTDNIIQSFSIKKAYRLTAAFGFNLSFGVKDKIKVEDTPPIEQLM